MIGEIQPPRLPHVFIAADRIDECCGLRSMQVAHQLATAKMMNPAALPMSRMATVLFAVWAPVTSNAAAVPMPTQTATRRPRHRPNLTTHQSEKIPPTGDNNVIAMKGVADHMPL